MDVLVLGGTVFLGPAVVREAQALGAAVTVFNRGLSGAVPAGVTHVVGDRTVAADLAPLVGRHFDVVVDTCGYVPAVVGLAARALAPTCNRYAFISSINAYPGWPEAPDYHLAGVHDGDPDATAAPDGLAEGSGYGWLKVGCERAVLREFGADRAGILRAGLIVGPHDSVTGRLPWWIDRVARGGEVLVPGAPQDPVSLIDARDLARFALTAAPGTFEATGPARDTRADLMAACRAATRSEATFTYVEDDWLTAQGVQGWTELPLWIGAAEGPSVFRHDATGAAAAGLRWRPLAETVADTWAWQCSLPNGQSGGSGSGWTPSEQTPGLAPAREVELLADWHATRPAQAGLGGSDTPAP